MLNMRSQKHGHLQRKTGFVNTIPFNGKHGFPDTFRNSNSRAISTNLTTKTLSRQ